MLKVNHPKQLTVKERHQCRNLSFRYRGLLSTSMYDHSVDPRTKVIRVLNKTQLLGWGLVFPHDFYEGLYILMLYVRQAYRRNGIGESIFHAATALVGAKNLFFYRESDDSHAFFTKCLTPYKLNIEDQEFT